MPTDSRTIPASQPLSGTNTMFWAGWIISGLVVLFLLFDGIAKLMLIPQVLQATGRIGYPQNVIRSIGIISLVCAALYTIPRTAIFGAILLTGFLGGAVAAKVRLEDPLFSSILFGVYVGVFAWGGLHLRDDRLRALIPLRRA